MKTWLPALMASALSFPAPGLMALPVQSNPVPQAILAVEETLDQATANLGQDLLDNANNLDTAGQALDRCNAEVTPNGTSHDETSRYFECRQQGLEGIKTVLRKSSADLTGFVGEIQGVAPEVQKAIGFNQTTIEQFQKRLRQHDFTAQEQQKRAHALAQRLPQDGTAIPLALIKEMRFLKAEMHFAAQASQLDKDTLSILETLGGELNRMDQSLEQWAVDAESIAYDYHLDAGLIEKTQENGQWVAQANILISQFHPEQIRKIATLTTRIKGFDYARLKGGHALLPRPATPAEPVSLADSPSELIQFFGQYR